MDTTAKRKGTFELSADTRILYNVLETSLIKNKEDFVSYEVLNSAIHRNVQGEARGLLSTARKNLESEHGVICDVIVGEGICLSTDYQGIINNKRTHIRKTARRTGQRVRRALIDKEPTSDIVAGLCVLNAVEMFSKPSVPKKLISAIENSKLKELSTQETLRLFQANGNEMAPSK